MHAPAAAAGGGGDGLIRAAVLALGRGGRQVTGQASRAGLDRRRVAEHDLPVPRLDMLVGHDDKEVHHRDEDDEVDDRGNEQAEVYERLGISRADFHAEAVLATRKALDDRVDDIGRERGNEHAEREGHD
jgi:hypothetical protein